MLVKVLFSTPDKTCAIPPPYGTSPQVTNFPAAVSRANANPFFTLYVGEARMDCIVSALKLGWDVGHREIEG
jgi:hypothetical protein